MKILLLTFYFHPDLSAGSFRATALVKALKEVDPSAEIHVVTTLPNRYKSFSQDAPAFKQNSGVTVERIALPQHKSGMFDQSMAFLSFAEQAYSIVRPHKYDLVFATSGRLMTASLGAFIAKRIEAPLYLDIRDIFVDTIKDVLPRRIALLARPFFSIVERWTVSRARKVNLVSGGFADYFMKRYPHQRFSYFTNGIDDEFLEPRSEPPVTARNANAPLTAVYAGNIGEGQGLHAILPLLGNALKGRVKFKVIGDGGRKDLLMRELEAAGTDNVDVVPPVSRDKLVEEYSTADVLFLHLNNYDAFRKVLPSKIFEYASMAKPVWAGVPGFSADFLRREVPNSAVFPPCNVEAAVAALTILKIGDTTRTEFMHRYARTSISRELAMDMIATATER